MSDTLDHVSLLMGSYSREVLLASFGKFEILFVIYCWFNPSFSMYGVKEFISLQM